ncbi:hypothetical protein N658DRAFT_498730 [Parathielavia hyrcaniae]|uniref:Uncharacterized protein n=1 Tax=Parathielavia hyrcaniae TaxID=113614 RepID=A0AAN6SZF9_9PEZI|nr:hypothetical protein N658DRAFT_498730 [Parathielavia hyrcaniae]
MQLALAHALLILLPLTTATGSTTSTNTTLKHEGLMSELFPTDASLCTSFCEFSSIPDDCYDYDIDGEIHVDLDCACRSSWSTDSASASSTSASAAPGQAWEDAIKTCFSELMSNKDAGCLTCEEGYYEPGVILDVCKIVTELPNWKTLYQADMELVFEEVVKIFPDSYTPGSGCAAVAVAAAGPGAAPRIAGVVLAAAVGWYAAVML